MDYLDQKYPAETRAVWDFTDGCLEGDQEKEAKKVAVSLELGSNMLDKTYDMLILHHPPKFGKEKQVTNPFYSKIKGNPVIYSIHSRIDVTGDMNKAIAEAIFDNFLVEKILDDGTAIIRLKEEMPLQTLIDLLKNKLQKKALHVIEKKTNIHTIAIHGGEGFNQHHVEKAVNENIDAYLAGDLGHHLAESAYFHSTTFIDIEHNTEQEGMKKLQEELQTQFPDCTFTFIRQKPYWKIQ